MSRADDERFMRECFRLAQKGRGAVSPNPMVGSVLVKRGKILARGYHARFGGPHAEVICLAKKPAAAAGATLYVNLEPCSHYGKTPPCVDRIIGTGVKRVVTSIRDPNPGVAGKGIGKLRRAGVAVTTGVLAEKARELNRVFLHSMTHGRPFVHVKIAESLDGKIAAAKGKRTTLSSRPSLALVHRWRGECDAIVIGAGTIRVPIGARVFKSARRRRVIIVASASALQRREKTRSILESKGVEIMSFSGMGRKISVDRLLRILYAKDIGSVLVEGGRDIFTQFLVSGEVELLSIVVAPVLLKGGVPAFDVRRARAARMMKPDGVVTRRSGRDIVVQVNFRTT
jgi:diaminohydroxyphosphoribosylaminopyrimidine deaminase/5-amino-6-(5-phosphoribosylamino)uracil reductase